MMTASIFLWITAIYLFSVVASWTTAVAPNLVPAEFRADAINSKWVAAVCEHGVWRNWPNGTVSQRPAYFTAHVVALVSSSALAFFMAIRASKNRKAEQIGGGNSSALRASP